MRSPDQEWLPISGGILLPNTGWQWPKAACEHFASRYLVFAENEDNCWEDCFPVIKDESAPSGYAIEKEDKRFALKNTITDQHGKPLHFYWEFALNEKGKWTNENGDLTFVNRRTISCLVIELTRIHNENGKASRNVCSKEHRHR